MRTLLQWHNLQYDEAIEGGRSMDEEEKEDDGHYHLIYDGFQIEKNSLDE